jgi:hypothetical protein
MNEEAEKWTTYLLEDLKRRGHLKEDNIVMCLGLRDE